MRSAGDPVPIVQQSNSFGPEIPVVATNDVDAQLDRLISRFQSVASPLRQLLRELHTTFQSVTDGCIANYIPELALADPDWFGISVVTLDGQVCEVGDSNQPFTVQSVSKPFIYGLALDHHGVSDVLRRVAALPGITSVAAGEARISVR